MPSTPAPKRCQLLLLLSLVLLPRIVRAADTIAPSPSPGAASPAGPPEDLRKLKLKDLPEKYRRWVDEDVWPIITDRERDVFLRLKSDPLRELFIAEFWRRRDPVPSTPENEYRDEYGRRLAYVKDRLKAIRQDQAQIYLCMGPPAKIDNYVNTSDWWPIEVWEYEELSIPGIPSRITLLFYKPRNAGNYRLWDPNVEGLKALRTAAPGSSSYSVMEKRDFNPARYVPADIAEAMRGVAPGLGPFASEQVLFQVQRPPAVDLTGVERILTGTVTTAISYGGLPFQAIARWYWGDDPARREVSIAIELDPGNVRLTGYKGKQYFGLFVAGQVRDETAARSPIVAEWSANASLELSPQEREASKDYPFLYSYRLRLLPGKYNLNLVARDDTSERLGIKDIPIDIPEEQDSGYQLSDPVLVHKLSRLEEASANIYAPWVFDRVEMMPSVDQLLPTRSPGLVFVQVRHPKGAAREIDLRCRLLGKGGTQALEALEPLDRARAKERGVQTVLRPLSLASVPEGSYELVIDVLPRGGQGAAPLASRRTPVRITSAPVAAGRLVARGFENADPVAAANAAGLQQLSRGNYQGAREEFRRALSYDRDNVPAMVNMARAMVLGGEPREAREAMAELCARVKDPEALMVLGAAENALGASREAAAAYQAAIDAGGPTPEALNALAEAWANAGEPAKARAAAERSLELKPDQPLLRKFLDGLGR